MDIIVFEETKDIRIINKLLKMINKLFWAISEWR